MEPITVRTQLTIFDLPDAAFADEYVPGQFETLVREKVNKRNF